MRLKKLTILGFKSFADKTVLRFDAGITCIVGPNGCGKSNISDAFRWVMGEQSAKSLRGAKMPDVIFAGANDRMPLNFAEVSMTLEDVQGVLPIDYEEVTVTRRLHRSGESEYLLNGNPVRLKDLHALFLDSGVGRNAFSIFEQGKLDQVIHASPFERRYIFEEAAGILRFLQSKKEALKRLEQADLNLSRVHDICLEVERQIHTLEAQAREAKAYKDQQAQLELLEKAAYVLKWHNLEKTQEELKAKQEKRLRKLDECRRQGALRQVESQEAKQKKGQHEKSVRSQSEALLVLRGREELQQRELQSIQQRSQEASARQRKLGQELDDLAVSRKARLDMLAEISARRQKLEADWSSAEAKWVAQQDQVKMKEKEVARLRQDLAQKHTAHLKALQQHSQWQSDLKQAEVRLENQADQLKQSESLLLQLHKDRDQLAQNTKEKKQVLQTISALVDSHKDRLKHFEEELSSAAAECDAKQKEIDVLRRKLMESKARQQVLLKMREEHEGFSSGGKRLLEESANPKSSIFSFLRPFYEYINPDAEMAEAVSAVLRGYAETLVVESAKHYELVAEFAEKEGLNDYSLICLEHVSKRALSKNKASPSLLDHTELNPLTSRFLVEYAIEETTLHLIEAWMEGKCSEGWSRQGLFVDHRGVLFKFKPGSNHVFLREAELKVIDEELSVKEQELDAFEQALRHAQHRRTHLQLERSELDKTLRKDEMKLVEANFTLQRCLNDQEKNQKDQVRITENASVLKEAHASQQDAFRTMEQQFRSVKQELERMDQEQEILQQELAKEETTLRIQEQEQSKRGSHYRQIAEDRQQAMHNYHLLEAKEQDHGKNVQRIEEELRELAQKQTLFMQEEGEGRSKLESLETEIKEAALLYDSLEAQSDHLSQLCEEADHQLALHSDSLKKMEHELAQLDMQIFQQRASLESISEELANRYRLSVEEALSLDLPLDRPLEQTERMVKNLRSSLKEAGDVNLSAIEDLEKHQVRSRFLSQQIEDLQKSKEELLGIIKQLDDESHQLFKSTFEMIRSNFKKNFQILFSGGEADLQFSDSRDIMEAGIDIIAKPPGKQMRSINLLSGGEKCLTAVALLFAIFEVKPAPFCILDEIDAPLDDSNVERFVNVVRHFADKCQFLIITHNKGTMAIADVLFGVSMEERGVSKLLSLEFAGRKEPAASLVLN